MEYKEQLKTKEWKTLRDEVLDYYDYRYEDRDWETIRT